MLYHIDDDPDSAQNHLGGTGDLTAVGVASVANAAAAAVIASATSGNSRKGSIKIATAKTDESPTNPLPERIHPGVSNDFMLHNSVLEQTIFVYDFCCSQNLK
jgi:hypothetical protein